MNIRHPSHSVSEMEKINGERDDPSRHLEYPMEGCGRYIVEITPESFSIEKTR